MAGGPKRRFIVLCIAVGVLTPALTGLVARAGLKHQGLGFAAWSEGFLMALLPTMFIVLPLYVVFAFSVGGMLPSPAERVPFRRLLQIGVGSLVGLTVPVV